MKRIALAVLLASTSIVASAAVETYSIEPGHTYPSFETSHMGISVWRGKFNSTSGKITLDRAAKTGTVDISIDAKSINFGLQKMDEEARSANFFNVEKYPEITYKGEIKFKDKTPVAVDGELTLLGVTKPVKLKIDSFKCIEHPLLKKEDCGANATAVFDRVDFGMVYAAKYGPTVSRLAIQIEAIKD